MNNLQPVSGFWKVKEPSKRKIEERAGRRKDHLKLANIMCYLKISRYFSNL